MTDATRQAAVGGRDLVPGTVYRLHSVLSGGTDVVVHA